MVTQFLSWLGTFATLATAHKCFPKKFPETPIFVRPKFKNLDNFVQVDIRPACSHFGRATTDLVHQTLSGVLRRPPQLIEYKETTQP